MEETVWIMRWYYKNQKRDKSIDETMVNGEIKGAGTHDEGEIHATNIVASL
jgi:hypothetical protein